MKMTYAQRNAEKIRVSMLEQFAKRAYWQTKLQDTDSQKFADIKRNLDATAVIAAQAAEQMLCKIIRLLGPQFLNSGLDIPTIASSFVQGYLKIDIRDAKTSRELVVWTNQQYIDANGSTKPLSLCPTLLRDPVTLDYIRPVCPEAVHRDEVIAGVPSDADSKSLPDSGLSPGYGDNGSAC
jgi:hypothetical protein